jgi:hypothetical protein
LREDAPRREAEVIRAREAEVTRAREAEAARARAREAGDERRYGPGAWAALNAARSRPDVIAKERPTANKKDSDGRIPLHGACGYGYGDLERVATLLLAGADINARDSHNETPLHFCKISWPPRHGSPHIGVGRG